MSMRIINFNCEVINLAKSKGFYHWLVQQDADIICLQNICEDEHTMESSQYHINGFQCYAYTGNQNNHSSMGVAIYCKTIPKVIIKGLADYEIDKQGTFIQADFDHFNVISLQVPQSFDQQSLEYKRLFLERLKKNITQQSRKKKDLIFAGTWNINQDFHNTSMYTKTPWQNNYNEINWLNELFEKHKLFNAYKEIYPIESYSYWKSEQDKRLGNGLLLDYQIITQNLKSKVLNAGIYHAKSFSNHAPIIIDYDLEFYNEPESFYS